MTHEQIAQAIKGLTNGERLVLVACLDSAAKNGYDFGFADELEIPGMSHHQVAGTFGSLVNKDIVWGERPKIKFLRRNNQFN